MASELIKPLTREEEVVHQSILLWEAIMQVDGLGPDDQLVCNNAIHLIQDMMFSRLYRKDKPGFNL